MQANNVNQQKKPRTLVAVIWIDWYAYHLARLRALVQHPLLRQRVVGIELVGGAGVHGKLVFREQERSDLPLTTLMPDASWTDAGQLRLACRVWRKLAQLGPQVVLVPGYYTLPAFAMVFWARLNGRRAILMTESTRQDHSRNRLVEAMKGKVLTRLFHAAITGGHRQAAYARELGFRDAKIARLYDVVDNDFFAKEAAAWREKGRKPGSDLPERYFVYVGRLACEKNISLLLRSYARYRAAGGTLSIVMVGDGPEAKGLKRQAAEAGLAADVHFVGLKNTCEIARYYAFADWFVLPSLREPWGLVVNEAMSAGLPIIISDRCGCSDDLLAEGRNGFGFDGTSEDDLTRALLCTLGVNQAQRMQMAEKSKELISRYSPSMWAEEVIRIANIDFQAICPAA